MQQQKQRLVTNNHAGKASHGTRTSASGMPSIVSTLASLAVIGGSAAIALAVNARAAVSTELESAMDAEHLCDAPERTSAFGAPLSLGEKVMTLHDGYYTLNIYEYQDYYKLEGVIRAGSVTVQSADYFTCCKTPDRLDDIESAFGLLTEDEDFATYSVNDITSQILNLAMDIPPPKPIVSKVIFIDFTDIYIDGELTFGFKRGTTHKQVFDRALIALQKHGTVAQREHSWDLALEIADEVTEDEDYLWSLTPANTQWGLA